MIKVVFFDLDGVLLRGRYASEYFHTSYNVPIKGFVDVIRQKLNNKTASETLSTWQPYLKKWGVEMDIDDFYPTWFRVEETKPIEKNLKSLNDLIKNDVKVGILSDNFYERMQWIEATFQFLEKLNYRFYSCNVGYTKVDREFYQYVCTQTNAKTDEILFFDDDPDNISAAKNFGINAYVYTSINQIKDILDEYNLLTKK